MANSGNTNNNEDILLNEVHKKVSVLQELYIELFATLMPGFVLILSILILLFLFHFFTYGERLFTTVLAEHLNPWLSFVAILVLSYTTGAILYRKDLKRVDRISSKKQWDSQNNKEQKKLAVQYEGATDSTFAEYPYGYLRKYLCCRGLYHLLIFIPWCYGKNANNNSFRSKTIINELKTIIKSSNNGHYIVDLLRNEAHIRMLTSMWYVMKYLFVITLILFLLGSFFRLYAIKNNIFQWTTMTVAESVDGKAYSIFKQTSVFVPSKNVHDSTEQLETESNNNTSHFLCAIVTTGIFLFGFDWGKRNIEKSIHYVRIREIVTVLEQAYHIRVQNPNARFWSIIDMRNKEFTSKNQPCECSDCDKIGCFKKSAEVWGADASKKVETKYNIHIKCDNDCAMIYSVSGNHFNKSES